MIINMATSPSKYYIGSSSQSRDRYNSHSNRLRKNKHPNAKLKNEFKKKDTHRALEDIKESIAELQHFRKHFFV